MLQGPDKGVLSADSVGTHGPRRELTDSMVWPDYRIMDLALWDIGYIRRVIHSGASTESLMETNALIAAYQLFMQKMRVEVKRPRPWENSPGTKVCGYDTSDHACDVRRVQYRLQLHLTRFASFAEILGSIATLYQRGRSLQSHKGAKLNGGQGEPAGDPHGLHTCMLTAAFMSSLVQTPFLLKLRVCMSYALVWQPAALCKAEDGLLCVVTLCVVI